MCWKERQGKSYQELGSNSMLLKKLKLGQTRLLTLNDSTEEFTRNTLSERKIVSFETKPFVMGKMTPGGGIYSYCCRSYQN